MLVGFLSLKDGLVKLSSTMIGKEDVLWHFFPLPNSKIPVTDNIDLELQVIVPSVIVFNSSQ